jgi:hypothetical protein
VIAPGASLVCRVEKTRWPVSDAWSASSAVSGSRISPTMTMSGSWRSTVRSAATKVNPILLLIWDWLMPSSWYSIGSSR